MSKTILNFQYSDILSLLTQKAKFWGQGEVRPTIFTQHFVFRVIFGKYCIGTVGEEKMMEGAEEKGVFLIIRLEGSPLCGQLDLFFWNIILQD